MRAFAGGCMARAALVAVMAVAAGSCSAHRIGVSRMAAALTATAEAYTRDDDPEFVRLAAHRR